MHTWSIANLLNWDLPIERWALTKRVRGKCWSSSLILDLSSSMSNVPFGRFFMVRGCTPPNWKYRSRKAEWVGIGISTTNHFHLSTWAIPPCSQMWMWLVSPRSTSNPRPQQCDIMDTKLPMVPWRANSMTKCEFKQFGNERYEFKKARWVTRSKLHLIKDAEWSLSSNF